MILIKFESEIIALRVIPASWFKPHLYKNSSLNFIQINMMKPLFYFLTQAILQYTVQAKKSHKKNNFEVLVGISVSHDLKNNILPNVCLYDWLSVCIQRQRESYSIDFHQTCRRPNQRQVGIHALYLDLNISKHYIIENVSFHAFITN